MITVAKNVFRCEKCGAIIEYTEGDTAHESCWRFKPNHRRAGYGSKFDGSEVVLDICDDCLFEFVETFKFKDVIHNSGSNTNYECQYGEEF